MSGWRTLVVAAALAATLGAPRAVRADDYPNQAGWGALSVLSNIGYMPAKSVYALVGGVTGGIAYACTAGSVASRRPRVASNSSVAEASPFKSASAASLRERRHSSVMATVDRT